MSRPDPTAPPDRRVLVLAGPSGAGKTRLAGRLHRAHDWPVVRLDDFYKPGDDPTLPMTDLGIPDWDHVDSFDLTAALAALEALCRNGSASVPTYDIATSSVQGHHTVHAETARVVVAEGIFAPWTIAPLRRAGLLADAYCVSHRPWITFARRLSRDLRERRKPPWVLLRRGLRLRAAEPEIVAEHERLGARPLTPAAAFQQAEALGATR